MADSNSTAAVSGAAMKVCGKCKKCIPASTAFFARKATSKDGLNSLCKECGAAYTKAWKARNPEHQKQWIEANRDAVKMQRAQYRQENKKKIKEAGDDEFRACWSLCNLRPLWAKENIAKGGRIVTLL